MKLDLPKCTGWSRVQYAAQQTASHTLTYWKRNFCTLLAYKTTSTVTDVARVVFLTGQINKGTYNLQHHPVIQHLS